MNVEVFFNRPARSFGIERVISEIREAQEQITVASAWFTDTEIAQAIIDSPAYSKVIILNAADVNRGSRKAVRMLEDHFKTNRKAIDQRMVARLIEQGDWNPGHEWLFMSWESDWHNEVRAVGNTDWQEGVMHHKFVVIDERVVWLGSYNLTYQARGNYETFVRIEDPEIAERFKREASDLRSEDILHSDTAQYAWANGAFRCQECNKLCPDGSMGRNLGSWYVCNRCAAVYPPAPDAQHALETQ